MKKFYTFAVMACITSCTFRWNDAPKRHMPYNGFDDEYATSPDYECRYGEMKIGSGHKQRYPCDDDDDDCVKCR
jgi:hypothetical protein